MFPPGQGEAGGPDLSAMLAQAQALQQQLEDAQDRLAQTRVDGSAGGGLVSATLTGAGELVGLVISPEAIDFADASDSAETIADLVLAAVRDASANVTALQQSTLGPLTAGLGGSIGDGLGALGLPPGA